LAFGFNLGFDVESVLTCYSKLFPNVLSGVACSAVDVAVRSVDNTCSSVTVSFLSEVDSLTPNAVAADTTCSERCAPAVDIGITSLEPPLALSVGVGVGHNSASVDNVVAVVLNVELCVGDVETLVDEVADRVWLPEIMFCH